MATARRERPPVPDDVIHVELSDAEFQDLLRFLYATKQGSVSMPPSVARLSDVLEEIEDGGR